MKKKLTIAVYVLITLGPLVLGLAYSLLYSLGFIGLMNEGFTLEHWQRLLQSDDALSSLGYSLLLTLLSLILILVLALFISWKQMKRGNGNNFYKILFLPLVFPPLIAGFAWFHVLNPGGIFSRLAYHLELTSSLEAFPRLVNDTYSIAIIITHVFLVFPLFTLLFIEQSKKERMPELMQISETLGGSKWQFFRRVFAPLLLIKSQSLIWLYGVFLFGTYEVPLLLGRSSPRVVTVFITEKLTKFNLYDVPVGHAMAVVYSLLILLIISLFVRKKTDTLI